MLGRNWAGAQATIVERRMVKEWHSNSALGESARMYEYLADIRPDDGTPAFRASLYDPTDGSHFRAPEIGAVVRVKFRDSARHQHGSMKWKLSNVKFDLADPSLERHNAAREADERAVAEANTPEAQARWERLRAGEDQA